LATAIDRAHLAESAQRAKLDAETERMRSSLLSAVSHDIKTPLSSIVAAGTTLIEHRKALDSSAVDRLLGTIVREGDRLGRLVQNLLSLSRLESPTIELRRTAEAVEDIVGAAVGRLSEALAPRAVRVELPADLPYVSAEPMLVEQVLLNLLENALRYTPPESPIQIAAQAGDGLVKVRVSDEGPGISEAEREKVFEKFYRGARTHKNDGGAGLGLTICRAIVEAHGGRIVVRARQGGGTVVEFTLPLAPAPAPWLPASAEEMIG
jgi:two-component system sensor histidine kinase KdpD